jgi:hypothetical protein
MNLPDINLRGGSADIPGADRYTYPPAPFPLRMIGLNYHRSRGKGE